MIQLATNLTAGKVSLRPAASGGKSTEQEASRVRGGHPWPFPSRYAARPAHHEGRQGAGNGNGSGGL
jgi:hypothetical protein